jgi:hypothetical protein
MIKLLEAEDRRIGSIEWAIVYPEGVPLSLISQTYITMEY